MWVAQRADAVRMDNFRARLLSNQSPGRRLAFPFIERTTLSTTRKRWNGNVDTLPADFLKDVLEKMSDYGPSIQFSLVTPGPLPSYQITNELGKAMAFDGKHHLLRPEGDEFAGANASARFTLDQIKALAAGARLGSKPAAKSARRSAGSGSGTGTRATAARLAEQHAAERYAYYKTNRASLPADITRYSDEIAEQMKAGKPVETAFQEIVAKYF